MKARFTFWLIGTATLWVLASPLVHAQQRYTTLYAFSPGSFVIPGLYLTNTDGADPAGGLTWSGSMLYGAANDGGTNGSGTLFAISTNGTGFKVLYTFSVLAADGSNPDGANPNGDLVLSGGTLYGTTYGGGGSAQGTIFAISTSGSGYTNLHSFSGLNPATGANKDGANPPAGLFLAGLTLFGTAFAGGSAANGTVFSMTTDGNNFQALYQFSATDTNGINSDGANPSAPLLLSGSTLYGTTSAGGTNGLGTVFALNTNGTFTVLHHFDTNGAGPAAGLVLSNNTLYGLGGNILFALQTDGSGFTDLYQFNGSVGGAGSVASPGLNLIGGSLYGSALSAGADGYGRIFSIYPDGSGFTVFHDFTPESLDYPFTNSDGAYPNGGLVVLNSVLYGAASAGGPNGGGVIFSAKTNSPPVLAPIPNQVLSVGVTLTITNVASDPDLDPLTFSLGAGAATNAMLNATNGVFTWVPAQAQIGTNTFSVIVSDNGFPALSATQTFSVLVVQSNRPPVLGGVSFSNNAVVLSWSAISGDTYRVQYKTNLTGTLWLSLAPDVLATGSTASVIDTNQSAATFYRVLVVQ